MSEAKLRDQLAGCQLLLRKEQLKTSYSEVFLRAVVKLAAANTSNWIRFIDNGRYAGWADRYIQKGDMSKATQIVHDAIAHYGLGLLFTERLVEERRKNLL